MAYRSLAGAPARHPATSYLGAMLLLGTMGVFVNEAGLDSVTIVFFRCAFGGAALLLYCWSKGWLAAAAFPRADLRRALLSGVLMVLNWVGFFEAIKRVGISVATVVFHVQPFLVLLLGALLFGERLSADKLAWVGIGFAGLLLATGLQPDSLGADAGYAIGIACTLGAALVYAGVTLTAKSIRTMRPHLVALIHCGLGVALLGGLASWPASGIGGAQWGWLGGLGVIHTALVYVLVYGALPAMRNASIAVLTFVYPAAAVACDYLVYGHRLGPWQLAGLGLIVLASLGVNLNWRWRRAALQ